MKKTIHVLISATYEATAPVKSEFLTSVIRGALLDSAGRRHLNKVITYQMPYELTPMQCGLKDEWDRMSEKEVELFADQYPELATAISLMIGVENGIERKKK